MTTWQVHNSLLLARLSIKHIVEYLSEMEAILQLDGARTVQQITSLESATPTTSTTVTDSKALASSGADSKSSNHVSDSKNKSADGIKAVPKASMSISNPDLDTLANQRVGAAGKETTK